MTVKHSTIDSDGEQEGIAGADAGDGQPSVLHDGEEGRTGAQQVAVEETPERDRAQGGGGAVEKQGYIDGPPRLDSHPPGAGGLAYIYFAISGCGRYMKIGSTHKPGTRARGLRCDARKYFGPRATAEYIGVVLATWSLETIIHRYFAPYRIRATGDWYWSSEEMMDYIREASTGFIAVASSYRPRGRKKQAQPPRSIEGITK